MKRGISISECAKTDMSQEYRIRIEQEVFYQQVQGAIISEIVRRVSKVAARVNYKALVAEAMKNISPEQIAKLTMAQIGARLSEEVKGVKKAVEDRPNISHTTEHHHSHYSIF
jgi:tRNA A37 N6-isopentenylltransferase MiaA